MLRGELRDVLFVEIVLAGKERRGRGEREEDVD